jgi:O-antigen/teichoic acid export membrane protein
MSLKKQIIMSIGSNWANNIITAAVRFLLIPVMLGMLGDTAYGVWALLAYGLAYPSILDSSFTLATNRFVAYYRKDPVQLNKFVASSFAIMATLAIMVLAAAVMLSFFVPDIFSSSIPGEMAGDARITCILVGVMLALKMLESSFSGALQGCLYYTFYNIVIVIGNILRAVFVVTLLIFWKSIIALQLGYVLAGIITLTGMYIIARSSIKGLRLDLRLVNRVTLKELSRYAIHSLARTGSLGVMYNTMTLIVGWAGSASDVAIYNIASMIPTFIRGQLVTAQNVLLPATTGLFAEGKIEQIRSLIKKGTKLCAVLTCFSSILLFIFAKDILVFWLRRPVQPELVLVMRVLILPVVVRGFFGIWLPVMVGLEHLRWLSVICITICISGIALSLILVLQHVFTPAMAPAVSQAIVLFLCWGIWLPAYGLYKIGMRGYEYLKDSFFQPILAAIISYAIMSVFENILSKYNIHWSISLILSTVIATVIFMVFAVRSEMFELIAAFGKKLNRSEIKSA